MSETAKERQKYELLYEKYPAYNTGEQSIMLAHLFCGVFEKELTPGARVLDFGCGRGSAARVLLEKELQVHLVDITSHALSPDMHVQTLLGTCIFSEASLWEMDEAVPKAEYGICFDVLEHIPEHHIGASLQGMAERIIHKGLFAIALREDSWGQSIGQTLHLTVKDIAWWCAQLDQYFTYEILSDEESDALVVAVMPHPSTTKA